MDNKLKVNVKTVVAVEGITLDLTVKQLIALAILTGHVVGSEVSSFRKETSEIWHVLDRMGIDFGAFSHLASPDLVRFKELTSFDEEKIEAVTKQLLDLSSGDVTRMTSPRLDILVREASNKIAAIKEFREIASNAGFPQGLLEAKHEIDRRFEERRKARGY